MLVGSLSILMVDVGITYYFFKGECSVLIGLDVGLSIFFVYSNVRVLDLVMFW